MPASQSRSAGQASAELVAILAVVALLLTAAATAVAEPDIPSKLVRTMRQGICIVAGDVCTTADAKAKGLDPCVTGSDERSSETGVTVVFVHVGGRRHYLVEHRSDRTVVVSEDHGGELAATAGVGFSLGPYAKLDAGGTAGFGFTAGRSWVLSEAEFDRIVDGLRDGERLGDRLGDVLPDARIHYRAVDAGVRGEAGVSVGDGRTATLPLSQDASGRVALGRRTGPDGTTWFFEKRGRTGGLLSDLLPGFNQDARLLVEYHLGDPPVLTLRTARAVGDRTVESIARLRLEEPGDRDAVVRYLGERVTPPVAPLLGDDLARRIAARGTLEHLTYATDHEDDGWNVSGRLGVEIGVDHSRAITRRRLVSADVVFGGRTAERLDCLAADAA